uniref:G_PROTEIN_RECEP_F1_2 domain-containing protein n=1 Tax=Heterorhabditis bacteriophora TaxID=37862 RepID=A0A1I7WXW2_HETBA
MSDGVDCSFELSAYNALLSLLFIVVFFLSLIGNMVWSKIFYINKVNFNFRSVACIPVTLLSELTHCWLLGRFMCKMKVNSWRFKDVASAVGVCASAYTLAVIAVERYYAICRPLESRKWQTKKRALITISFVWFFSFMANVGSLAIFDSVPYRAQWTCDTIRGPIVDFLYQLYVTFVLLFIPLSLMVGLYGHVIFALTSAIGTNNFIEQAILGNDLPNRTSLSDWLFSTVSRAPSVKKCSTGEKQSLTIPASQSVSSRHSRMGSITILFGTPRSSFDSSMLLRSTHQDKILVAKRKVTRMLIIIVIVFAACWIPSYTWWLLVRTADLLFHEEQRLSLEKMKQQQCSHGNKTIIFSRKEFLSYETAPTLALIHEEIFEGLDLWHSGLNMALTILTYVSSMTNPITYCFMNKSFRASIFSYCHPRKSKKRRRIDDFNLIISLLYELNSTKTKYNFFFK